MSGLNAESSRFLSTLTPLGRKSLLSEAKNVHLPVRTSLYRAERTPLSAYFITSGLASVVTTMLNGATLEVGLIGNEGLVGSLHLLGGAPVSTDCFIQIAATGFEIPLVTLRKVFHSSEEIRKHILNFVQEQALTGSQVSACQRLHEAEPRLARWLLMTRDRTQSDVLNITQEFLAMMLGTQRTTVTMIAGRLQKRGLIHFARGKVMVTDPKGLEAAACGCYAIIKRLYTGLFASPAD
jgi:CRP-like cAMP-binding protein